MKKTIPVKVYNEKEANIKKQKEFLQWQNTLLDSYEQSKTNYNKEINELFGYNDMQFEDKIINKKTKALPDGYILKAPEFPFRKALYPSKTKIQHIKKYILSANNGNDDYLYLKKYYDSNSVSDIIKTSMKLLIEKIKNK